MDIMITVINGDACGVMVVVTAVKVETVAVVTMVVVVDAVIDNSYGNG